MQVIYRWKSKSWSQIPECLVEQLQSHDWRSQGELFVKLMEASVTLHILITIYKTKACRCSIQL